MHECLWLVHFNTLAVFEMVACLGAADQQLLQDINSQFAGSGGLVSALSITQALDSLQNSNLPHQKRLRLDG